MLAPVSIYIIHHPHCKPAEGLAKSLYDWFRLGYLSGDSSGAGLPVHYRRQLNDTGALQPPINVNDAALNVMVVLVDHKSIADVRWRTAMVNLALQAQKHSKKILLLPVAMHDSFYRSGPLYEGSNPIRLLDMTQDRMISTVRRAVTEATARRLRGGQKMNPPPLDVFLSHAKRDGRIITEKIRDSVRKFGQLVAWYDANDLPYGAGWRSPMEHAARENTAAMIATVTDAYPTRSWCRKEARLARTPVRAQPDSRVWKVQPTIAVHQPGAEWSRGVPMLQGVPQIGWIDSADDMTERIVDRLVLEVLLGLVHRTIALELDKTHESNQDSCYITWTPDGWTLSNLRQQLGTSASSIRWIVYPGYGLTSAEIEELQPDITSFHADTKLISFEEAM